MRVRTGTTALFWTTLAALGCNHDPDGLGGVSFASGQSGSNGDEDDESGGDDDDESEGEGETAGTDPPDPTGADETGGDDGPVTSASTDPDSGGESDASDTAADSGPDSAGAGIGECSNFTSVEQFHSWLNTERQQYAGGFGGLGHDRYKGYPWQGEGHQNFTFTAQFAWDDALAAQAQAEADALASGSSPTGHQQNGSNGLPFCPAKPFWIDGINTAAWKISFAEVAEDWMPPPDHPDSCPAPFALSADNQHSRMGLLYHDFGGDGPAIDSVGVGAAIGADCQVWWVLQFGT